jgi:hypothetical protein
MRVAAKRFVIFSVLFAPVASDDPSLATTVTPLVADVFS